jgi:predicted RNA-binding protein Jag
MKYKILLSILIVFLLVVISFAQTDSTSVKKTNLDYQYKNIVKISSLALAFKNVCLTYERAIWPGWSVSLNAGLKSKSATPNMFGIGSDRISISNDGVRGFSVTPELRYYIKSCDNFTPNGFYAAFYMRYVNYKSGVKFNYYPEFPDLSEVKYFGADISLNNFGLGLMLGYQLTIKKRFILDFIIIGPRQSWVTMKYKFDENISEEFIGNLEDYVQEIIDRFGVDHQIKIDYEGVKNLKFKYNFTEVRFGIALGYAF